jgi:hypothetical protein
MPRGDRTGPAGMGPMSGRGAGYCARFDRPGFANRAFGRYFGANFERNRGLGSMGGHGWRHMFWATGLPGWMRGGNYYGSRKNVDPATEKQELKYQEGILQSQLNMVKQRMSELDSSDPIA